VPARDCLMLSYSEAWSVCHGLQLLPSIERAVDPSGQGCCASTLLPDAILTACHMLQH
jgi:hypothetical protein